MRTKNVLFSRFGEIRFGKTGFGESGFGELGRHRMDSIIRKTVQISECAVYSQLMMQEYDMPGSYLFELVQSCATVLVAC